MSEANDTQGTSMKDRVGSLAARIRGMSKPALIMIATTLVATLGLAAWLGVRASSEPYAVLFGRLSPEDAASVAEKLKEMKAPYKVGDAGTIEVPESRVHELRLEVAGAGLPRGGGVGFESFDKMKLGATEFEQQVMFRRAMEGELARTITSVSAIESARVHLVLPEKSVFVQKRELGSASVIVKLQPGRDLGPQEIGAIVHLVSSAVPGLAADRVTLATTEGALLRKPKSGAPGADIDIPEDASAATRSLETSLEERVKTMLDKVIGAGHADVKVRAEMDFSQVERTEDKFKPKATALRSEELLIERTGGGEGDTVAGVPGAESNLPTGDADTETEATTAMPGVTRRQHTRNFEVDRVTEKRVNRVSTLKRLTVAVAVDGVAGVDEAGARTVSLRDPEELEQIEKLVRSAVGADDRREDLVTVECIPFSFDAADAAGTAPEAPVAAAANPLEAYKKHAPYAVAGAIGLAAIVMLLAVRRARKKARERASLLLLTATPVEKLLTAEPVVPALSARSEALRRAEEDPATAALVIRHWLGGAEQETQRAAV
ncbi:MAG: flagellar M-ring protein FliF [Polyangiaceae bacterium]|nr:flagellar M-ring protein FliF [Polyangiaceae bacterium]